MKIIQKLPFKIEDEEIIFIKVGVRDVDIYPPLQLSLNTELHIKLSQNASYDSRDRSGISVRFLLQIFS